MNKEREYSLKLLGFNTYSEYLNSKLWKSIRFRILNKRKNKGLCEICNVDRATQVHHKSYSYNVMIGKNITELIPCCYLCHKAAEFDQQRKTLLEEANRRMYVLSKISNGKCRQCYNIEQMEGSIFCEDCARERIKRGKKNIVR